LGIEPLRRERSSVYTAAKYLPVPRAGNGNSLIQAIQYGMLASINYKNQRKLMVVFVLKKVELLW